MPHYPMDANLPDYVHAEASKGYSHLSGDLYAATIVNYS
jgi:hypothetical protein